MDTVSACCLKPYTLLKRKCVTYKECAHTEYRLQTISQKTLLTGNHSPQWTKWNLTSISSQEDTTNSANQEPFLAYEILHIPIFCAFISKMKTLYL